MHIYIYICMYIYIYICIYSFLSPLSLSQSISLIIDIFLSLSTSCFLSLYLDDNHSSLTRIIPKRNKFLLRCGSGTFFFFLFLCFSFGTRKVFHFGWRRNEWKNVRAFSSLLASGSSCISALERPDRSKVRDTNWEREKKKKKKIEIDLETSSKTILHDYSFDDFAFLTSFESNSSREINTFC